MSLHKFETYQLALTFHANCRKLALPLYLRDQLLRAAASVALNLAEGSAKTTPKEQRRFYVIAAGSLRESQAVLDLAGQPNTELAILARRIGAMLFRLCHPKS